MKVFLFGSHSIVGIPVDVEQHLRDIMEQTQGNVEFIVGDCRGIDESFHRVLSRIGARSKTTVYCMNFARTNKFDFATKVFDGEGLEGRDFYEFKDREMCRDCDFAIGLWDGKSKGTMKNVNLLKILNKPVYFHKI